jgi:hypothetical protein
MYEYSRRIMTGMIELIEFLLLCKLPWFGLVCFVFICVYVFV